MTLNAGTDMRLLTSDEGASSAEGRGCLDGGFRWISGRRLRAAYDIWVRATLEGSMSLSSGSSGFGRSAAVGEEEARRMAGRGCCASSQKPCSSGMLRERSRGLCLCASSCLPSDELRGARGVEASCSSRSDEQRVEASCPSGRRGVAASGSTPRRFLGISAGD